MRASSRHARTPSPRSTALLFAVLSVGVGVGWWLKPAAAAAGSLEAVSLPSFAPIVEQVRDGVVAVFARHSAEAAESSTGEDVVSGSGFIIHDAGLVVTNHHIVAGAADLQVEVAGGRRCRAELVGADPVTDIAVLRLVDPPDDLLALQLGDSTRLRQGDWVVTVGNPLNYNCTVTAGVVSYVGRHISEEGLLVSNEFLQFSAPVHPGSSGGPVLDTQGEVVGVITASHGVGSGLSFAVPSKVLRWVIEAMGEHSQVERGWLGVDMRPLDEVERERAGLGDQGGALLSHVQPDTPADRAGLRDGDVVVAWDGQPVPDAYTLFDWITYGRPGAHATVEVVRDAMRMPPLHVELGAVAWRDSASQDTAHTPQAN